MTPSTPPKIIDTLKSAWHYSSGVRTRVLSCCLLGILRVALGLTFVWISKKLVDAATSAGDTDQIVPLSILLAALMIGEMAVSLIVQYIENKTEVSMKNQMRSMIYSHLLSVRHDVLGTAHSADYVNRLNEDTRVLAEVVTRKLPACIVFVVQFFGAFFLLAYMSLTLALCVIAIMPVFIILSKMYVTRTRKLTAEVRDSDSRIHTCLQEGIQHHVVVQTLECENEMSAQLSHQQDTLYKWTMQRTSLGVYSRGMMRLGFIACYLTAFIWSVWHLHTGTITYGTMTAFLQLVGRIQVPMANMSQLVPALVNALTSIDRLRSLQDMPTESDGECVHMSAPVGIRIEDLTFSYSPDAPKIFDKFNYDFTPASKTVIMGETGIGKSTLVRLLMALLTPEQGKILIYDRQQSVPVSKATRCNIVYVPQGNSLFDGTIRENLLLADPDATESMIHEALYTAVATFVYDLPQGLDTRCGELGASLSEGQAQRIAIARALLRRGAVLVLDEFNSALDSDTAATLIHRLTEARADSTIIFISHRQEVASYCDRILRL